METRRAMMPVARAAILGVCLAVAGGIWAQNDAPRHLLAGTWTLLHADIIQPDGPRITDPAYGENVQGLLMVASDGRYSLQIFRPDRPKFAVPDKTRGTAEEYRAALLGMSTHVGRIVVDEANRKLVFQIEWSAYPNWEHTEQKREFELSGTELTYQVPPTTSGTRAVSVWRRVQAGP